MPNLDGIAAAKQITEYQKELTRVNPRRHWVPIIAVTAYEDDETLTKCLEAGISRVINKPVSLEKLDAIVNELYYDYDNDDWTP